MHSNRRDFLKSSAAAAVWTATGPRLRALAGPPAREILLAASPVTVDVGGRAVTTWAYNGRVPGPEIRVRQGERLRIVLRNDLPQPTTIHWHGLPVPNAQDGVPGLTQGPVAPGETFVYEFDATTPGTYFYHSHQGLQLDRGLYGPLVIEPASPPPAEASDREHTLVLDDWLDGTPEEAYAALGASGAGGMGGMGRRAADGPLYARYLVNGAPTGAIPPLRVARGERVRLRLVNASAATTMRVGVAGHRLTVTHSDGQPVEPVDVDTLVIGMGERYDVVLRAENHGAWPLVTGPADSSVPGAIVPVIYEGTAPTLPPVFVWPTSLWRGRTLRYADLVPSGGAPTLAAIDRVIPLTLGWSPFGYVWTINGQAYPDADPIALTGGERVRLQIFNATMMRHPMHLHGHFFEVVGRGARPSGLVKDTVLVEPMMGGVALDFTADNPGRWFFHCHHLYHMEAGMARALEYV